MLIKRLVIVSLTITFVLSFVSKTFATENNTINLFFGDKQVEPEIRVIDINGVKFINLPFFNKYLYIISKWDPDSGMIELQFGNWHIKMNEDRGDYTVNNKKKTLMDAPFEFEEQLWFPIEFLTQFGIVNLYEAADELRLNWAKNYLLQIETINYQNRPAVLLIGAKNFNVSSSNLLVKPDRLMIDLADSCLHPAFSNNNIENPTVKAIRTQQTAPEKVRLIFELFQLTGYKIVSDPSQPDHLIIVFNCFLEDVQFIKNESELKIQIKTSLPAEYRVMHLKAPDRLVIDLDGATVGKTFEPLSGDGWWFQSVRIAQFDPHTVRVVLDLIGNPPCFAARSRENPNLIDVRTVAKITRINWSEENSVINNGVINNGDKNNEGKMTVNASGELLESISRGIRPNTLWIDLNYAQFDPQLNITQLKSKFFNNIRLVTEDESKVSIMMELNGYFITSEQLSDDRHQLTVFFKKSPLQGKTLVLDPGHGGVDVGTIGGQGTYEKDINIEVAMRLKNLLEEIGANVVFTRIDDSYISLYERPFIANFLLADLFVSIHSNSYTENRNIRGIEIYYRQNNILGKLLAEKVLIKLSQATHFNSRGAMANDYAVLKETQMPGILIELGYLSNFQEEAFMETPDFRDNAAQGIFEGIIDYFTK